MRKVQVFVEGPSDKAAMGALLAPLLRRLLDRGVAVHFFDAPSGDRKKAVLLKVPEKAVNILRSESKTVVVAMPDLYPKNRGFPHTTPEELAAGILRSFRAALERKGLRDTGHLEERFKVFCFKHDLEALVLASFSALKARLGVADLKKSWKLPAEDVDHEQPPKRVVEALFESCGQRYKDTVDAPLILSHGQYEALAEECSQCFKPFVQFLSSL